MKKYLAILLLPVLALALGACSAFVSDESYAKATQGSTVMEYTGFTGGKETLTNATMLALQKQGWTITDPGAPIKAEKSELRQEARVSISVHSDKLVVDTKGSLVDGNKAYVPLDYLNSLTIAIREYTLKK